MPPCAIGTTTPESGNANSVWPPTTLNTISGGVKARDYMRWVQASVGANIRMIPTSEILFFRAEDKYTRVQTRSFEALIRKPIKELIDELDPDEFWQIHRATRAAARG